MFLPVALRTMAHWGKDRSLWVKMEFTRVTQSGGCFGRWSQRSRSETVWWKDAEAAAAHQEMERNKPLWMKGKRTWRAHATWLAAYEGSSLKLTFWRVVLVYLSSCKVNQKDGKSFDLIVCSCVFCHAFAIWLSGRTHTAGKSTLTWWLHPAHEEPPP